MSKTIPLITVKHVVFNGSVKCLTPVYIIFCLCLPWALPFRGINAWFCIEPLCSASFTLSRRPRGNLWWVESLVFNKSAAKISRAGSLNLTFRGVPEARLKLRGPLTITTTVNAVSLKDHFEFPTSFSYTILIN